MDERVDGHHPRLDAVTGGPERLGGPQRDLRVPHGALDHDRVPALARVLDTHLDPPARVLVGRGGRGAIVGGQQPLVVRVVVPQVVTHDLHSSGLRGRKVGRGCVQQTALAAARLTTHQDHGRGRTGNGSLEFPGDDRLLVRPV